MIEPIPPSVKDKHERYGSGVHQLVRKQPLVRRLGKFWHQLGPGLTTGAADDDPSRIATYSQTGSQCWMTTAAMAVVAAASIVALLAS